MVIELVFDLGGCEVIATCDASNTASEAVMRSCGMLPQPSDDQSRVLYALRRS